MTAYIKELAHLSMKEIMIAKYKIEFTRNILFGPISHDGVFWTKDAIKMLKSGQVPTDKTYIISTNSWEGSLFGQMLPQFKPNYFEFDQIDLLQGLAGIPTRYLFSV
jgi:carboxylesterase type B